MVRSSGEIGGLWPLCKECGHIAQSHNVDGCSEPVRKQCPTCGQHGAKLPCGCKEYDGPSIEEFCKQLTPEEIRVYFPEVKTTENERIAQITKELAWKLNKGEITPEDVIRKLNQYPAW